MKWSSVNLTDIARKLHYAQLITIFQVSKQCNIHNHNILANVYKAVMFIFVCRAWLTG